MTPPDISVSIVSYNTRDLLRACLLSLLAREAAGEATLEIWVADNGSADGSVDMARAEFPAVRVIETGGNIGYGRANNAALAQAAGRYFFVLNSDTEVEPGALGAMRDFLDTRPEIGMLGAQLILPDGSTQASCATDPTLLGVFWEQTYLDKLLPANRITGAYAMTHWDYKTAQDVPQVCGACFFVRRAAWEQIGGFDPAYFMYFEDTDLCVRLRRAGWPIYFFPDARIKHHLGASSRGDWRTRARMVASYNQSRYYFYTRTQGPRRGQLLRAMTLLGAALRWLIWRVIALRRPAAREQVDLFRDVWRRTRRMRPDGEGYNPPGDAPLLAFGDVLARRAGANKPDALATSISATVSDGKKLGNTFLAATLADDELGTWALDAATVNFLEREIQQQPPSAILEFGAGLSTLCFARFMYEQGHRDSAVVFSIEQNEWQIVLTRERLARMGLERLVAIYHAPLIWQTIAGQQTECYALPPGEWEQFLEGARPDFVVVDGPSGDNSVRFGTLPLVQDFVAPGSRYYLDDALRDDELEVARRWSEMPGIAIAGVRMGGKGLLVGTASPVRAGRPQGTAP